MIDFQTYQAGTQDEILILELTGRLDDNSAEFLVDCLSGHIKNGANKIVLDCAELQHVSSTGLAALVRIHSRLKSIGGEVKLAAVAGVVTDILRIVHFDRLFHIYPSVEEACQALQ
ncbi:MAG: STAS domain-containing protein [Pirellulales bacterium]|nr:STAS domain-containing protein [Pirellulales bacterium]